MTNYFCNVLCDFSFIYQVTGFWGGFLAKVSNECSYFVCIFILFKNYHPKCFDISERRKY